MSLTNKSVISSVIASLFFICLLLPSSTLYAQAADTECVPSAPDGYKSKACVVTIDRNNPASPTVLIVHGKTRVTIRVKNARWNENVSFTTSTSRVVSSDILGTLLKSAVTPLQGLVLNQGTHLKIAELVPVKPDPIIEAQKDIMRQLDIVSKTLADANVGLTCLETFKALITNPDYSCDNTTSLNAATFPAAKDTAVTSMLSGAAATLPLGQSKAIDQRRKAPPLPRDRPSNWAKFSLLRRSFWAPNALESGCQSWGPVRQQSTVATTNRERMGATFRLCGNVCASFLVKPGTAVSTRGGIRGQNGRL